MKLSCKGYTFHFTLSEERAKSKYNRHTKWKYNNVLRPSVSKTTNSLAETCQTSDKNTLKLLTEKNAILLSYWRLDIGIKDRPVFIPNHTKKLILFTTGQRLNFWVAYRWMFQNARSRDSANFRSFLSLRFSKRESVSAAETSRSQSLDSVRCSRERLSIS